MWETLSDRNPHRALGLAILDRLQQVHFDALPTSELSFSSKLSPAHVIRDLFAQPRPRYRNQVLDVDDDDALFCDFVAGWAALAHDTGADVTDISQTPFASSDIPATQQGLRSCGIQYPAIFNDPDVCVRPEDFAGDPRNYRLTTTISPDGSITDPHIDGTGSGLILLELFGTKILFTWPASAENLRWMNDQHGVKRGPLKLLRAIDELSAMRVNVLTEHKSVELTPGMIHAVMSASNSAIAGWDFINARWLSSDDVSRQMLWEVDLAERQSAGLLGERYSFQRYLKEDLELWSHLSRRDGPYKDKILGLIQTIRTAMQKD
jgi:hypothetical protein